jgi:two-component system, chemotaxis family, sensor kinase Cph1
MSNSFQALKTALTQLEMPSAKKTEILNLAAKVENEEARLEFKYMRSTKDRDISINLLKATVEALEKQKMTLEIQSQQVANNLRALEMSYSEMEQFTYIASHDLKTPLRNISGFAKLLKQRYHNMMDEGGKEYIDFIVNNTQMMSDVINNLLVYSRVDHDKELAMTNFEDIIERIKNNLKTNIQIENATITADALPTLRANKSGMTQLLQHLVENALKFRSERTPKIHISAQIIGDNWQFSVKDNGVGLDETYQDKAFQPFQRINQRDRPGMGMGLAICRKVAKMHGGNIWFLRNLPQNGICTEGSFGTTFHFTIPQLEMPII